MGDPHWFRGNSYFRIGWEWLKAAPFNAWRIICKVQFTSNRDSDPVMASRRQHLKRAYRIKFSVQIYRYKHD